MSKDKLAPLLTPQEIIDGNYLDKWIVLIYHEQEQVVPFSHLGDDAHLFCFDSKDDALLAFDPTRGKDPLDDYLPAAVPVADVMDFFTAKANGIVIDDEWWLKREGYELHTIGWSTPTWLRTDEAKKEAEDDPEDSSDTLEQDWEADIKLRQEAIAKATQLDDQKDSLK